LVAFLVALIAFHWLNRKMPTTSVQWNIIIYLGAVAGAGYFWNQGVIKVNTGSLAIMNNALIPVGLIVVIWNKGQILRRF
jgi:drug/metabolite transporter (DMT)-like permease